MVAASGKTKSSETTGSKGSQSKTSGSKASIESNGDSAERYKSPESLSRIEFLFAALAFAIRSGNAWVLPPAIARAGMTFFAQYAICYILAAVPMLYMEIAMGQYSSASPWGIYQMLCPAMSGVPAVMGFTLVLRSIATSVWIAQFLALSGIIVSEMTGLWDTTADFINCKDSCYDHRLALRCTFVMPSENETDCKPFLQSLLYTRGDDRRSTPLVFLMEAVLREAQLGASDSIIPDTSLLLALVVTWAVTGLTSVLGLRFFSKFAYVIVALAVAVSVMLLTVAITMGDIARAVRRISTPHFNLLGSYEDWLTAAGQALITLNVSTGGMIKLASARGFRFPIFRDVGVVAVCMILYHAVILLAIFGMAETYADELYLFEDQQNRFDLLDLETFMPMAIVAEVMFDYDFGLPLTSLQFITQAVIPLPVMMIDIWVIVSMLWEKYTTSFGQEPRKLHEMLALVTICTCGFIISFLFIIPGRFWLMDVVSRAIKNAILFLGFLQLVTVAYIYGFRRFTVNIRTMVAGRGPLNVFWWLNWIVSSPFLHVALFRPRKDWGPMNKKNRDSALRMERAQRVR